MQPYIVSGVQGLTFLTRIESEIKYVYVKKGRRILEFSLHGYGTGSSYKDAKGVEPLFDQILSTFKFID